MDTSSPTSLKQIPVGATHATIQLGATTPKRDYIFVEDAADGFLTLVNTLKRGPAFDTFNICRGEEFSVAELVGLLGAIMGVTIEITHDPKRTRKVDRIQQLGDATKMAKENGWRASLSLHQALERMIGGAGRATASAAAG